MLNTELCPLPPLLLRKHEGRPSLITMLLPTEQLHAQHHSVPQFISLVLLANLSSRYCQALVPKGLDTQRLWNDLLSPGALGFRTRSLVSFLCGNDMQQAPPAAEPFHSQRQFFEARGLREPLTDNLHPRPGCLPCTGWQETVPSPRFYFSPAPWRRRWRGGLSCYVRAPWEAIVVLWEVQGPGFAEEAISDAFQPCPALPKQSLQWPSAAEGPSYHKGKGEGLGT